MPIEKDTTADEATDRQIKDRGDYAEAEDKGQYEPADNPYAALSESKDDEPEEPTQYEPNQPERIQRQPREAKPAQQPGRIAYESPAGEGYIDQSGQHITQPFSGGPEQPGQGVSPSQMALYRQEKALFDQLPEPMRQHYLYSKLQLTQAEQLHMQKLQQGENYIKQAMQDGSITKDVGNDMLLKLNTNMDPYKLRLANAQVYGQEIANRRQQEELATMQRNKQQVMEEDAKNSDKGITQTGHPELPGGMLSYTQIDPKTGLRHAVPGMPGSKEYIAEKQRQDKAAAEHAKLLIQVKETQDKIELGHVTKDEEHWDKIADEQMDKVRSQFDKGEAIKTNEEAAAKGALRRIHYTNNGIADPEAHVHAERMNKLLESPTREKYLKKQADARAEARKATPPKTTPTTGTSIGGVPETAETAGAAAGSTPGTNTPQTTGTPQPPFSSAYTPEKMTEEQKKQVDSFAALRTQINTHSKLTAQEKTTFGGDLTRAQKMLEAAGSVNAMKPADQQAYYALLTRIATLPKQGERTSAKQATDRAETEKYLKENPGFEGGYGSY